MSNIHVLKGVFPDPSATQLSTTYHLCILNINLLVYISHHVLFIYMFVFLIILFFPKYLQGQVPYLIWFYTSIVWITACIQYSNIKQIPKMEWEARR